MNMEELEKKEINNFLKNLNGKPQRDISKRDPSSKIIYTKSKKTIITKKLKKKSLIIYNGRVLKLQPVVINKNHIKTHIGSMVFTKKTGKGIHNTLKKQKKKQKK